MKAAEWCSWERWVRWAGLESFLVKLVTDIWNLNKENRRDKHGQQHLCSTVRGRQSKGLSSAKKLIHGAALEEESMKYLLWCLVLAEKISFWTFRFSC